METLSSDLTELILPWVAVLMSAIIAFIKEEIEKIKEKEPI